MSSSQPPQHSLPVDDRSHCREEEGSRVGRVGSGGISPLPAGVDHHQPLVALLPSAGVSPQQSDLEIPPPPSGGEKVEGMKRVEERGAGGERDPNNSSSGNGGGKNVFSSHTASGGVLFQNVAKSLGSPSSFGPPVILTPHQTPAGSGSNNSTTAAATAVNTTTASGGASNSIAAALGASGPPISTPPLGPKKAKKKPPPLTPVLGPQVATAVVGGGASTSSTPIPGANSSTTSATGGAANTTTAAQTGGLFALLHDVSTNSTPNTRTPAIPMPPAHPSRVILHGDRLTSGQFTVNATGCVSNPNPLLMNASLTSDHRLVQPSAKFVEATPPLRSSRRAEPVSPLVYTNDEIEKRGLSPSGFSSVRSQPMVPPPLHNPESPNGMGGENFMLPSAVMPATVGGEGGTPAQSSTPTTMAAPGGHPHHHSSRLDMGTIVLASSPPTGLGGGLMGPIGGGGGGLRSSHGGLGGGTPVLLAHSGGSNDGSAAGAGGHMPPWHGGLGGGMTHSPNHGPQPVPGSAGSVSSLMGGTRTASLYSATTGTGPSPRGAGSEFSPPRQSTSLLAGVEGARIAVVWEDLRLRERLGSGAGGTVYRATHIQATNKNFAVKKIDLLGILNHSQVPSFDRLPEKIKQQHHIVHRELQILHCHYRSPFLLKTYDAFYLPEKPELAIVMELMDFGSLEDLGKHFYKLEAKLKEAGGGLELAGGSIAAAEDFIMAGGGGGSTTVSLSGSPKGGLSAMAATAAAGHDGGGNLLPEIENDSASNSKNSTPTTANPSSNGNKVLVTGKTKGGGLAGGGSSVSSNPSSSSAQAGGGAAVLSQGGGGGGATGSTPASAGVPGFPMETSSQGLSSGNSSFTGGPTSSSKHNNAALMKISPSSNDPPSSHFGPPPAANSTPNSSKLGASNTNVGLKHQQTQAIRQSNTNANSHHSAGASRQQPQQQYFLSTPPSGPSSSNPSPSNFGPVRSSSNNSSNNTSPFAGPSSISAGCGGGATATASATSTTSPSMMTRGGAPMDRGATLEYHLPPSLGTPTSPDPPSYQTAVGGVREGAGHLISTTAATSGAHVKTKTSITSSSSTSNNASPLVQLQALAPLVKPAHGGLSSESASPRFTEETSPDLGSVMKPPGLPASGSSDHDQEKDSESSKHHGNQRAPVPERAVCVIGEQCLLGLDEMHKNDHIHRDIKPANILVNKKGGVRISDFGLAEVVGAGKARLQRQLSSNVASPNGRSSGDGREDGEEDELRCSGTNLYMSPERQRGEQHGPPADIWALGVTLAESALARYPFDVPSDGATDFELMAAMSKGLHFTIEDLERLSVPFVEFLKEATHADPKKRPTASELLKHEALSRWEGEYDLGEWLTETLEGLSVINRSFSAMLVAGGGIGGGICSSQGSTATSGYGGAGPSGGSSALPTTRTPVGIPLVNNFFGAGGNGPSTNSSSAPTRSALLGGHAGGNNNHQKSGGTPSSRHPPPAFIQQLNHETDAAEQQREASRRGGGAAGSGGGLHHHGSTLVGGAPPKKVHTPVNKTTPNSRR